MRCEFHFVFRYEFLKYGIVTQHQKGSIGIIMDVQWYEPISDLQEDIDAAERMMVFQTQW